MEKQQEAIAICRVSTAEQKSNNSLTRQEESVNNAASELGVKIVRTWSGDASSKVGKNVNRKDLLEAQEFCRTNKRVKYLIVDEVDRFMRSTAEMFYWIVTFKEVGVKVWFATNPELNGDDAKARLFLSLDGFKSEGSNEERQHKSISGHERAIREGRYTFCPKPGYIKGADAGVHQPDPSSFVYLQRAFQDVASGMTPPLEALRKLNNSGFSEVHAPWKMDKFRKFGSDPYYAGIINLDSQVKGRNEYGLHQAMITKDEHESLVAIFTGKYKPRGPRNQYNPDFPMNKILLCETCGDGVKFTGSKKNNGYAKKVTRYYFKYHCRGCNKAYHREDVHDEVSGFLDSLTYNGKQREDILDTIQMVWTRKQKDKLDEIGAMKNKLESLEKTKSKLVLEMINIDQEYKQDVKNELDKIKVQISELEEQISPTSDLAQHLANFAKFALEYTNNLAQEWWSLTHDQRVRCQQIMIPGGFLFNSEVKVGTHNLSPIFSVMEKKKTLKEGQKSLMVELAGTAPASD
jgi:DNA invertase Pin-like site-specific DNA recombinase